MFYRRKVALALIQAFGGKLGKLDFQKLLFLFTQSQAKPAFDFVPYKYGCFSFQANADMKTMIKYDQVAERTETASTKPDTWIKTDETDYRKQLTDRDQMAIDRLRAEFGNFTTEKLIRYTYQNYPYYAIHSKIASSILTLEEQERVAHLKPHETAMGLFSIGYEGKSLEQYVNALIEHDMRLLCDVRKNSKSMKFGFSKNQLAYACRAVGIEYMHIPELGIDSEKRQSLHSQQDYDLLFAEYRNTVLMEEQKRIVELAALVQGHRRVAITCFEADINQCHRKHLADAVVKTPGWCWEMEHI